MMMMSLSGFAIRFTWLEAEIINDALREYKNWITVTKL